MVTPPDGTPRFEVVHESDPSETLLAGFSAFGLAGLTAVDYLVDHLDLEMTGHISVDGVPAATPFENGRPRRHTRLFSRPDLDVTVLVAELFVPPMASQALAGAIVEWAESGGASEAVVLSGVPIAHGPDEHRTYYVATDGYRERRLADDSVPPMGRGFLDGVNASLVERGLDSSLDICTYITPVHAQAPDIEAAIRLVETVAAVYDVGIDAGPLEAFAAEIEQYYAGLAERLEEREISSDDRMYM